MPRLSEVARHFVIPQGIVTTGWPAVVKRAAEFGLHFDWWQDTLGQVALGKRKDGKYAATIGGVALSIPRQAGKTWFVVAVLAVLCTLHPGLKVIWTAHHARTSTSAFRTLQAIVRRRRFATHLASVNPIRVANGEQEVHFANGSVIMFGARARGFGRGFDAVDAIVFDEAQILPQKALDDMVASSNQARHPAGALLFYMGTPPQPGDPCEAFTRKRREAISGDDQDTLYLECSADPGCNLDDRKQWAKANLSFPQRTPVESMLRLRKNLGSEDSWRREGLGIWDELEATERLFPPADWDLCLDRTLERGDWTYGLAVGHEARATTIAVSDGRTVEVLDWHEGSAWAVPTLEAMLADQPGTVWLREKGPTGALLDDLAAAGIEWENVTGTEYAQSCAGFHAAVTQTHSVAHIGQPVLNIAIRHAEKRSYGEGWLLDPTKADVDISPAEGVILARSGALKAQQTPKSSGPMVAVT